MINRLVLIGLLLLNFFNLTAQNTRLVDQNEIGWYNYFGTFKIADKLSIHSEYQWRRDQFITEKQQGLLRVGLNYQVHPKLQLRLGTPG
jgi:hypothetical protein